MPAWQHRHCCIHHASCFLTAQNSLNPPKPICMQALQLQAPQAAAQVACSRRPQRPRRLPRPPAASADGMNWLNQQGGTVNAPAGPPCMWVAPKNRLACCLGSLVRVASQSPHR